MNIALIRIQLSLTEMNQLVKEFPQFLFISSPETETLPISEEYWSRVEVLFFGQTHRGGAFLLPAIEVDPCSL